MKTQIMNLFRMMEKSGEMGKSLKSLKSLMQIFATFATSASAIFVGKESNESTVRYALWSRISLIKPLQNPYLTLTRFRLSLGSAVSRVSLASLICLCMLTVGSGNVWGTTYNFSSLPTTGWSASGGSNTINSISWTYSSATHIGENSSKIQVGSRNNPQTSAWTIQTAISNFGSNKKITAVAITAYTTATTATYNISVGGSSVKSGSLTTSSDTYTASSLNVTSGNIVITMTGSSTSKAMYLANISVTYDDASSTKTYTLAVPKGDGTYDDTQTGQEKTALTEANAIKKRSCGGGDLEGTYMGIWVTSAITKASNTTTYPASYVTSSTADGSLPVASKLYPVFYIYPNYFTDPRCETYYVLYDGNGNSDGSEPEDNTYYAYNATVTVKTNSGSLTKTGYSFNGWNTKADGTGTHFSATPTLGTFSITQDTILYAEWICANAVSIAKGTESNCSISFSSASVSTCSGTRQVTVSVTPSSCYAAPVKASVTSSGTTATWVSGPTQNSGHYDYVYSFAENATGTTTFNASLSTKTTYTISYAAGSVPSGGGSITGSHANGTKTCGDPMDLPGAVFETTGYTQTGWSKTNGGSQYAAVGGSYTDDAAQTFYPVWTVKSYSVTWKVNNTTYSAGGSASVNHGSHIATLPTAPSPASYCGDVFVGWTTDENYVHNTSPLYTTASGFPTASGAQVFYAVFADYTTE